MRIPICFLVILLILYGPFASASWWGGSSKTEEESEREKSELEIKALEQDIEEIKRENANLENENAVLKQKGDNPAPPSNRIWWWIACPVTLFIFLYCFVFRDKSSPVVSPTVSETDHPKCPRCGLEHNPGDTVCKNPNCQTYF